MKPLTLDALREAGACKKGIVWITPLLEAGGPSEADWLERPDYWEWAVYRTGQARPVGCTPVRLSVLDLTATDWEIMQGKTICDRNICSGAVESLPTANLRGLSVQPGEEAAR